MAKVIKTYTNRNRLIKHYEVPHSTLHKLYTHLDPLIKANSKDLQQRGVPKDVADWASKIKNQNIQSAYIRAYFKDPSIHTEQNMAKISHMDGMTNISDDFKNIEFDKNDSIDGIFNKFDTAERRWQNSDAGAKKIKPDKQTHKVIDLGNGMAWVKLDRPTCLKEGKAVGHCGNTADPHHNDKIYSLRKIHNIGGVEYHEPMLTFINNSGWLGEMKGKANSKPDKKYHEAIAELLKHESVKGLCGAENAQQSDFHFDDLDDELKKEILEKNKNLVDIRSGFFNDKQKEEAIKTAPRDVRKYHSTIAEIEKTNTTNKNINSGKWKISNLAPEDLKYASENEKFSKSDFERMLNYACDPWQGGVSDLNLVNKINTNKHLSEDHINPENKNMFENPNFIQIFAKKFNKDSIDKIVNNLDSDKIKKMGLANVDFLFHELARNKNLTNDHVSQLTKISKNKDESFGARMVYHLWNKINEEDRLHFAEHHPIEVSEKWNKLRPKEKNIIIQRAPQTAVQNWDSLDAQERDLAVKTAPYLTYSYWNQLTDEQKDYSVKNAPQKSVENWGQLTNEQRDHIAQNAPYLVTKFWNHEATTPYHKNIIFEKDPYNVASNYLNDLSHEQKKFAFQTYPVIANKYWSGLTSEQKDHTIVNNPDFMPNSHWNQLNDEQKNHVIQKAPNKAIANWGTLSDKLKDHLVINHPTDVFLNSWYRLNDQHKNYLIDNHGESISNILKNKQLGSRIKLNENEHARLNAGLKSPSDIPKGDTTAMANTTPKLEKSCTCIRCGKQEQTLKKNRCAKCHDNFIEILIKACPRCGSASKNKSNPAGRCSSCLSKLKADKKTPGHWQRAQTKADDALRRQDGKNGTASKKSSGRGSRSEIVNKIKSAEKKTGKKLSPDRVDNSKGYASSNVRAVPEELNRGRHKVDPKKLANWRKRLNKSKLDLDDFESILEIVNSLIEQ